MGGQFLNAGLISGGRIGTVLTSCTLYGFNRTILLVDRNMLAVEEITSIEICFGPQ